MPTSSALDAVRGALVGALLTLRVDTVPSPACRPRVARFGVFYAKGYQVCMADCVKQFSAQKPGILFEGDLFAHVEAVVQRPKKTIRVRPAGDVDNYAKAPLDAATKAGLWGDDGQVTALLATKRWTEPGEEPGINLTIGKLT